MSDAIERWREIERALLAGEPLPESARRYLAEIAQKLLLLADDERIAPESAAKRVPEVIEVTGQAIRSYRDERRAHAGGWLFEWSKEHGIAKRGQIKRRVADMADMFGVTTRQIYRWGARFRNRRAGN
jgi:hypothetical protein